MASNRHTQVHARAFSLIEMMAVLAILAILLAIGVPAIKSMIYSSERSLAENQLRVALTAARDAAVRSGGGDGAAVFYYRDGRTEIIPCVSVGRFTDNVLQAGTNNGGVAEREVFVPVEGIEPVRMPRGWNVRGYASPGAIATGTQATSNDNGWYDCVSSMPLAIADRGHWVFPETDFFDHAGLDVGGSVQGEDEGWKRSTFMIRFEAGTGNAAVTAREPAVVLDPLPVLSGEGFRSNSPYNNDAALQGAGGSNDPTQAPSLESYVKQVLGRPVLRGGGAMSHLAKLIGDSSPDTVLAMPLTEVALYDEARMASAIGATRLNATTGCLYDNTTTPAIDVSQRLWGVGGMTVDDVQKRVDAYITRNATGDLPDSTVPLEARVFTVQRYMGQMQEVSPEVEE
ncbi:MAG: prepilin-type N-terminal cleavage/methylation domain-containing protein [Phycisphaerales bacterium]